MFDAAALFHSASTHNRRITVETDLEPERAPAKFRSYIGAPRVPLPGRDFDLPASLGSCLAARTSVREFAQSPLDLERVGRLLHACYGVRAYRRLDGKDFGERPVPSGGGLYPLELYVVTEQVTGLDDGLYHYDPRDHELEQLRQGALLSTLADMTVGQDMLKTANIVAIITAVMHRSMHKYRQRGYRFALMEAGHLGQNFYLVAPALRLGAVTIGGFFDDEVTDLLQSPEGETPLYLICIGQPTEAAP